MKDLIIRPLEEADMDEMFVAFNAAFSTYAVNMQMSRADFDRRTLRKIHIDFPASVGAFDSGKLVGFIFHNLSRYEGTLAAYNGGTGVIPTYRGHGLVKRMYDFIRSTLKARGVKKCVLEVLQSNLQAQRSYGNCGFSQSKDFQCLVLYAMNSRPKANDRRIVEASSFNLTAYQKLTSIEMNMLDQLETIQHHWPHEMVLEAREQKNLVGFLIFQPSIGRISHLATAKNHRKRGIATALLTVAFQKCRKPKMSVLNINSKNLLLIEILERIGFEKDLTQYEMQWTL